MFVILRCVFEVRPRLLAVDTISNSVDPIRARTADINLWTYKVIECQIESNRDHICIFQN